MGQSSSNTVGERKASDLRVLQTQLEELEVECDLALRSSRSMHTRSQLECQEDLTSAESRCFTDMADLMSQSRARTAEQLATFREITQNQLAALERKLVESERKTFLPGDSANRAIERGRVNALNTALDNVKMQNENVSTPRTDV